ncbi:hypothetical protein BDD12DRAFT_855568 [Trichophaea hybrida]|nr:hypothetical protein BDD12DRAFT_855568 [Trichophaea hybrida]
MVLTLTPPALPTDSPQGPHRPPHSHLHRAQLPTSLPTRLVRAQHAFAHITHRRLPPVILHGVVMCIL